VTIVHKSLTLVALAALLFALFPLTAAGHSADTCEPSPVYGDLCFDTLPKLVCCSAAYAGWSQVAVGDRLAVTGRVAADTGDSLWLESPSGRRIAFAVSRDGTFREIVSFDEEGLWKVGRGQAAVASFAVAYRVEVLDLPTQETADGNTAVALPAGVSSFVRVRFTDAAGRPAAVRPLRLTTPSGTVATDANGVGTIDVTPRGEFAGWDYIRLYPGLMAVGYREVRTGATGLVTGLPGGDVQGLRDGDRWLIPLRDFLEKVRPGMRTPGEPAVTWDERTRTIHFEGLRLLADTGHLLDGSRVVGRIDLTVLEGRTYLELSAMARLLGVRWQAALVAPGVIRIGIPEGP
jgi:hypothetical protein